MVLRSPTQTPPGLVLQSIDPVGWVIVAGSLAAGALTLGLIWYLRQYWDVTSARWFVAALAAQAVCIFAYTFGLLTSAPLVRTSAEALTLTGVAWIGPLFFAFAVAYTGRSGLLRSRWFGLLLVAPVVTTVLAATHPLHSLLWREAELGSTLGLVTVEYALEPWGYVATVTSLVVAGAGVLLLVETIASYGPLYRNEAVAVALSTFPPSIGLVAGLLGVGPWPALNLGVVLFLPHVLLDAYAFVGTHMFETNPTTQRAAERGALSDLDDPLLVLDPEERVVNANGKARALFDAADASLPIPLEALVGADLQTLRDDGEIEAGTHEGIYAVSYTPLTGPNGNAVGGILVLYDVTTVRRQKRRLSVLDRVLRHNLRNRLHVAQGRTRLIESESTAAPIREHARAIQRSNEQLLSVGRQIRDFQRIQKRDLEVSTVDPVALAERVATTVGESHPAATLRVTGRADDYRLDTDGEILELALANLLENAVVHSPTERPVATVTVSKPPDGRIFFEVRDENDAIPDVEIETLTATEESPLQHGRGIGFWIVRWSLDFLDGELEFAYEDGNVVTVTLPRTTPVLDAQA